MPEVGQSTPLEQLIAECKVVLGREDVLPTSNFFELGGDSLAALELIERVSEAYGLDVSLDILFLADDLQAVLL